MDTKKGTKTTTKVATKKVVKTTTSKEKDKKVTKKSIKPKTSEKKKTKKDIELSKTQNIPISTKVITDDISNEEIVARNNNIVIIALVIVLASIMLVFLGNKTFFRTKYKNKDFSINLPMFLYYVEDKDNTLTLTTLRKSEKIKAYFDEYLSNLENYDFYNCINGDIVYYNEKTKNAIYDIDISKSFALKTIKIKYEVKDKACD